MWKVFNITKITRKMKLVQTKPKLRISQQIVLVLKTSSQVCPSPAIAVCFLLKSVFLPRNSADRSLWIAVYNCLKAQCQILESIWSLICCLEEAVCLRRRGFCTVIASCRGNSLSADALFCWFQPQKQRLLFQTCNLNQAVLW